MCITYQHGSCSTTVWPLCQNCFTDLILGVWFWVRLALLTNQKISYFYNYFCMTSKFCITFVIFAVISLTPEGLGKVKWNREREGWVNLIGLILSLHKLHSQKLYMLTLMGSYTGCASKHVPTEPVKFKSSLHSDPQQNNSNSELRLASWLNSTVLYPNDLK